MHLRIPFTLVALLWIAACQPSKEAEPAQTGGLRTQATVLYCGETELRVEYLSSEEVRVTAGSETLQMVRVPSASGSKYQVKGDATSFVWLKGERATLKIDGRDFPECGPARRSTSSLQARGNEPGWTLRIDDREIHLETDYGQTQISAAFVAPTPTQGGRIYLAQGDEHALRITVLDELCADDMTGMPYPYQVTVEYDGQSLRGCGGNPASLLEGESWLVEDLDGKGIIDHSHMTLEFKGNKLSGSAGCNSYTTSFVLGGEGLSLATMAVTQKSCAESLMTQEDRFLSILQSVARFSFDETGALLLHTADGRRLLARR